MSGLFFISLRLATHVNTETNPGPKSKISKYFSFFYWDVNSILAHDKPSLLTTYKSIQHNDIYCNSETYSDLSTDENTPKLFGYSLSRANLPDNMKCDGVCLYCK